MTSSRRSTAQGSARRKSGSIITLENTYFTVLCATYTEKLEETIHLLNTGDNYISIVPWRIAEEKGVTALAAAHLAAYIAALRGRSIARTRGLDTLLYLLGTRNITKAIAEAAKHGDRVVVATACPLEASTGCIEKLREAGASECELTDPSDWRLKTSTVAAFTVEARIYRQQASQQG